VVLGCRVLPNGEPSGTLAVRARLAAQAFKAGVAPRIVAAGGRRWHGRSEAEAIARVLLRAGVPEHVILLQLWAQTTNENAVYTAALMKRQGGCGRVAIATSAWHMKRALANFRAAGLTPEPVEDRLEEEPHGPRGVFGLWLRAYEAACTLRDRWAK